MKDSALDAKVATVLSHLEDIQVELGEIRRWAAALADKEKDPKTDE